MRNRTREWVGRTCPGVYAKPAIRHSVWEVNSSQTDRPMLHLYRRILRLQGDALEVEPNLLGRLNNLDLGFAVRCVMQQTVHPFAAMACVAEDGQSVWARAPRQVFPAVFRRNARFQPALRGGRVYEAPTTLDENGGVVRTSAVHYGILFGLGLPSVALYGLQKLWTSTFGKVVVGQSYDIEDDTLALWDGEFAEYRSRHGLRGGMATQFTACGPMDMRRVLCAVDVDKVMPVAELTEEAVLALARAGRAWTERAAAIRDDVRRTVLGCKVAAIEKAVDIVPRAVPIDKKAFVLSERLSWTSG